MKSLILLFLISTFTIVGFGQVKKTTTKPASKQTAEKSSSTNETQSKTPIPTQKVVIEKNNGDKITGLFFSGNTESVTIDISGSKVPINLSEIKAMWMGEAKPEPEVPKVDYVGNAIKSLKQLSAATEVGVNFQDYGRRVIDVKAEVENNLSQIDNEYIKNEINLAMNAYVDASSAWNFSLQTGRGYLFIDFEPAITLRPKYNLPTVKLGSLTLIENQTALSIMWKAAKTHIENASKGKP